MASPFFEGAARALPRAFSAFNLAEPPIPGMP
jgi:hypothetical protein